jgi:membrane-bound serine protease (ClpP class)
MLFSPIEPFWHVSRLLIFGVTGMTAAFLATLVYLGITSQHSGIREGHVALVGQRGVALSDIAPSGVVRVRGEEWSAALAEGAPKVRKGHGVIIKGVNGLTVEIEPAGGSTAAAGKRSAA